MEKRRYKIEWKLGYNIEERRTRRRDNKEREKNTQRDSHPGGRQREERGRTELGMVNNISQKEWTARRGLGRLDMREMNR